MTEVCPVCGEDPEASYRCQQCGKDLVGSETEEKDDLMADGGQEKTTDEVVIEQIESLDGEGKHGAPIGALVEGALEETEVSFSAVFETIDWLHSHGEIYCPARGYLRETPEIARGDDSDDIGGEQA